MNLPSDTPRLPKWVFLAGDLALLVTAWLVWSRAPQPVTGMPLIATVVCVVAGVVLGAYPFIADYARRQDEALDNRQRALQALALTVTSSAEQIAIAASGLDRLAGIAQENFNQSDKVAQQIQEKMAELLARLAEANKGDGEAAARLEAVSKKIARTVADFEVAAAKAREPAPAPHPASSQSTPPQPPITLEVPPVLASQIVEIKPAVAPSTSPFSAPADLTVPPITLEAAPPPAPEPPAPRKRAPRKPAADPGPDLILESQPAPAPAAAEAAEPAADGATRLVVTAYIGIGNRLFIRGSGPGLSWEKGVPLTFVSIGKWRWESAEASSTVKFKLYKNDEIECTALGERSVEPGAQQSLTAAF